MGTVTITGVSPDPEIYGANLAAAANYISARFGAKYDAWLGLATPDLKGKTLVSATDFLDRLGLVDETGTAIGHGTAIEDVIAACFEMAVLINDDPDIVEQIDQASNIKKVFASGAGVEYHAPTSIADGSASKLPHVIQQLLGPYLPAADVTVIGGYGSAGDTKSSASDCHDYDRSEPY